MSGEQRGKPPGVVFDLDGTLADTLDDIAASINFLLTDIGNAPVARERIRSLIGEGLPSLLQRASGIADAERVADLVQKYRPLPRQLKSAFPHCQSTRKRPFFMAE